MIETLETRHRSIGVKSSSKIKTASAKGIDSRKYNLPEKLNIFLSRRIGQAFTKAVYMVLISENIKTKFSNLIFSESSKFPILFFLCILSSETICKGNELKLIEANINTFQHFTNQ